MPILEVEDVDFLTASSFKREDKAVLRNAHRFDDRVAGQDEGVRGLRCGNPHRGGFCRFTATQEAINEQPDADHDQRGKHYHEADREGVQGTPLNRWIDLGGAARHIIVHVAIRSA